MNAPNEKGNTVTENGMTERTIHEIRAEYGEKASAILNGYHETLDTIRDSHTPDEGTYLDRLTDDQRMNLLREQKAERADDARSRALEEYTAEHERYEAEARERRAWLKGRLFSVTGPDGAAALSRTVTASEGELSAYLDAAIQAGNEDLARAVFVAAERRGSGDILGRYFDEMAPEARDLYAEWTQAPTEEMLKRQREGVELVVREPDYDRLIPPARINVL